MDLSVVYQVTYQKFNCFRLETAHSHCSQLLDLQVGKHADQQSFHLQKNSIPNFEVKLNGLPGPKRGVDFGGGEF